MMSRRTRLAVVTFSTLLMAALLAGAVLGQKGNPEDPYLHLSVFTEVLQRIKSDYVEEPNMKSVTLGAINGLLVSVDPFASYLNADQLRTYEANKENHKAGVGLLLSRKYGTELSVVDSIPGSPADEAGLTTGDIVEKINGISTRDMPLAYAYLLLNGEPGSEVELTVLQIRNPESTPIKLKRRAVTIPPPSWKMLEDRIGYIQLFDSQPERSADVAKAVKELTAQGAEKLILDLRRAVKGDPDEGISLASLFVDRGNLGYLQGQKVERKNFQANPSTVVYRGPLAVLVNRSTSNGAEVAAAALAANKRAEVVGEKTYGWAALQKTIPTGDGGAVIMAIAKYYTPEGKAIQNEGVTPTVPVADLMTPLPDADEEDSPPAETPAQGKEERPGDLILKKAIEVLKGGSQTARSRAGEADWLSSTPESWSKARTARTEQR